MHPEWKRLYNKLTGQGITPKQKAYLKDLAHAAGEQHSRAWLNRLTKVEASVLISQYRRELGLDSGS